MTEGSGETRLSDQIASLRRFAGTTLYRFNTIDFEYEVVQIDLGALLDVVEAAAQDVALLGGTTMLPKTWNAALTKLRAALAFEEKYEALLRNADPGRCACGHLNATCDRIPGSLAAPAHEEAPATEGSAE